jgi:hypothetical protein
MFTETDPITEVLPTKGWLADYVKFTSPLEACTRFHFFSACCILGAVLNNKVYIHRGDPDLLPKLFPNPWIILLAPPGRGHKTSTINLSINCLQAACPEVRILADKLTPESLVKALSEPQGDEVIRIGPRDATGLIKAPELSVFFGKQQYNTGLVSLITDLYDYREEWVSETIMRGKMVLKHNVISILGGSTPDWLQTMLPQDAFTGGFMSRFIIVEMPPNYLRRRAFVTKPKGITWEDLVKGLSYFKEIKGEVKWTQNGLKTYVDYYESLLPTGDVQRDAYQERESEQILKLAMLLAISEHKMKVDSRHMSQARKILNFLMKETEPRIERLTTHPRMKLVQEIQDILRVITTIDRKSLLRKVYRSLEHGETQFQEAIRILTMTGIIELQGNPNNPKITLAKQRRKGK